MYKGVVIMVAQYPQWGANVCALFWPNMRHYQLRVNNLIRNGLNRCLRLLQALHLNSRSWFALVFESKWQVEAGLKTLGLKTEKTMGHPHWRSWPHNGLRAACFWSTRFTHSLNEHIQRYSCVLPPMTFSKRHIDTHVPPSLFRGISNFLCRNRHAERSIKLNWPRGSNGTDLL